MLRCPGCSASVIFIPEAFQRICSNCGTIYDDGAIIDERTPYQEGVPTSRRQNLDVSIRLGAKLRASDTAARAEVRQYEVDRGVERSIIGILSALHCSTLKAEVERILHQAQVLSIETKAEQNRIEGTAGSSSNLFKGASKNLRYTAAAAACFAACHKRDGSLTLESVCAIANLPCRPVRVALQQIECLLCPRALIAQSRDEPGTFLDGHITLLSHKLGSSSSSSRRRQLESDPCYFLHVEDRNYLDRARIDSVPLRQCAHRLAKLCADHGLHNRVSSTGKPMDLSYAAWAILLLAIEAQVGEPCNEAHTTGYLAHIISTERDRLLGGAQMSYIEVGEAQSSSGTLTIADENIANLRSIQELIKKRYNEIKRLLTLYVRVLPWHQPNLKVGKRRKGIRGSARQRKTPSDEVGMPVNDSRTSPSAAIQSLGRETIVHHLREVLELRSSLEPGLQKTLAEIRRDCVASKPWDLFKDTDARKQLEEGGTLPNFDEKAFSDEAHERTEGSALQQESGLDGWWTAQFLHETLPFLLSSDDEQESPVPSLPNQRQSGHSVLAERLGPHLLTEKALQNMTDDVADRLLFENGEMNSYMRSPDQVKMLRKVRLNVGDWDLPNGLSGTEEQRSPSLQAGSSHKRQKRSEEAEIERLLVS